PVDVVERHEIPTTHQPTQPRTKRRGETRAAVAENKTAANAVEPRRVELQDEEVKAALSHFSRPGDTSALSRCDGVPTAGRTRIWGQVNRLFPLKAACRWIVNAAATNGQWPELPLVMGRLALDAAVLGSMLERCDSDAGRKRDEMLGTGLPRKGNLQ